MSHSSGIPVSQSLKDAFGAALSSKDKRFVKAMIENDQIVEKGTKPLKGSFEDDLSLVPDLLEKDQACYLLVRMDPENQWALFCYVPDKAKVKDKMLYASTRSNLKQQLGSMYFTQEIFGTLPADFSKDGFRQHVTSQKMEAPLTETEQMKQRELESGEIYSSGQSTYVHGVAFPVDAAVVDAVKKLPGGSINYVQIAIDITAERITLAAAKSVPLSALSKEVPIDEPRFHFYAHKHTFEGAQLTSYVFVFSCPDGSNGTKSAQVKHRMLYSSSKANVANILTSAIPGTNADAKLEINAPSDISETVVVETLHPPKEEKKEVFAKPTRAGKGGRKLIR